MTKNFILFFQILILTILLFLFKINFIEFSVPLEDSNFYINWINSLKDSTHFFPQGDGTIIENLYQDVNSFLNQFFRRFFNNFTTIFNSFGVIIFYLLSYLFGDGYVGYYKSSILVSSFIPFLLSLILIRGVQYEFFLKFFLIFFVFVIYISTSTIHNYSIQGIHNLGVLTFIFSIYLMKEFFYEKHFLNYKTLIFAILIPFLTHSINFIVILPILFISNYFRYKILKKKFSKFEIYFYLILCLAIIFLFIFSIILNLNNIQYIKNFIDYKSMNEFIEDKFNSIKFIFIHVYYSLSIVQLCILFISFFLKDNFFYKITLIIFFFIFIFGSLDKYYLGPFLYFLNLLNLIIFIYLGKLIYNYFNKNNEKLFIIIFISLILFNFFYETHFSKKTNFQKEFYKSRYDNSEKEIIDNIKYVKLLVDKNNLIFDSYDTQFLYYAINPEDQINSNIKPINSYAPNYNFKNLFNNKYIIYLSIQDNADFKICNLIKYEIDECKKNYLQILKNENYIFNGKIYYLNIFKLKKLI